MKVGNLNYLYKKIFLRKLLPLCHHRPKIPLYKGEKRWWQQGGRWQQGPNSPTPNPSPKGRGAAAHIRKPFTNEKTAFSCGENSVFLRRKRFLHRDGRNLRAAAPLPFGEGLGVGLLGLCCHLPPCCHHLFSPLYKGILGRWWQSGSKNRKKIFSYVTRHIIARQYCSSTVTKQHSGSNNTAHRHQRNSASTPTIRHRQIAQNIRSVHNQADFVHFIWLCAQKALNLHPNFAK